MNPHSHVAQTLLPLVSVRAELCAVDLSRLHGFMTRQYLATKHFSVEDISNAVFSIELSTAFHENAKAVLSRVPFSYSKGGWGYFEEVTTPFVCRFDFS